MSQPKFNKSIPYSRAYGSGPRSNTRMHRLIRPLFWEQLDGPEHKRILMQRMDDMADMIRKTKEKLDGH